jgi:hypothetical protein
MAIRYSFGDLNLNGWTEYDALKTTSGQFSIEKEWELGMDSNKENWLI